MRGRAQTLHYLLPSFRKNHLLTPSIASMMFYAVNTFIFGNGPYGSKLTPNIHGLRHFLKRVPKNHIAGIQKVNILIHCRTVLNAPELSRKDVLGTMPDVKDLHSTTRALAKHFTSLKMIVFHYNLEGPSWDKNFEPYPLLTPEEGVSELAKMFRILVKKGLNFETFDHHNIKMRQAAEKVMKEIPGAAKIITLPPHSS